MVRLSVLAGAGGLVPEVVRAARERGYDVQILPLTKRTDLNLESLEPYNLADLRRLETAVKAFRSTHLTLCGGVDISDALRMRYSQYSGGSGTAPLGDIALSLLAPTVRTRTGARLVGAHEIAPQILIASGLFAGPNPDPALLKAARLALKVARGIGSFDIGQAAIVSGERVIAVEDIAGTDALLARVAGYVAEGRTGARLALAKAAKPRQPLFVDLPAIGPDTVNNAAAAGIAIIALQARKSILIDRAGISAAAANHGIAIIGL